MIIKLSLGVSSLTATANHFLLSRKGCLDHGRGTAHPTLHVDGPGDAIELAGAAFHADLRAHQDGQPAFHLESRMRTDLRAYAAAIALGRIVDECIFQVGIQHFLSPIDTVFVQISAD